MNEIVFGKVRDQEEQIYVHFSDLEKVKLLARGTQSSAFVGKFIGKPPKGLERQYVVTLTEHGPAEIRMVQKGVFDELPVMCRNLAIFAEKVANPNPDFFAQIFDWGFVRLQRKFYFYVVQTMLEGSLAKVYKTMSIAEWYSMLSQLCIALNLVKTSGMEHNDVFEGNLAFKKTKLKYTFVTFEDGSKVKLPNYGKFWKLIDYGDVDVLRREKNVRQTIELDDIIELASGQSDVDYACEKKGSKLRLIRKILKGPDAEQVKKLAHETGLSTDVAAAILDINLYACILCMDKFVTPRSYIPTIALLQMAKKNTNYVELCKYFAAKALELETVERLRTRKMKL